MDGIGERLWNITSRGAIPIANHPGLLPFQSYPSYPSYPSRSQNDLRLDRFFSEIMNDLEDYLRDREWRLRNLYKCREEGRGRAMDFRPRPEQELIFKHLVETPTVPAYIIKSRRLGLSTGICTFNADAAVFESGWRGVLIDRSQEEATKKMVEIIRFAIDNMEPELLRTLRFGKRNDSELRFRVGGESQVLDSVIYAITGHRGGDCNMLHVSEWGPIAATDAVRSREIRTGALPAARLGRKVVETTWMGGKGGDLWELVKPLLEKDPDAEGVVYFFPWHDDPEAVKIGGGGEVTRETEEYFLDLAGRLGGKKFSPEQKRWWAGKKLEQGMFMSREYPSTLEEAFRAPVEGAVFAGRVDEARAEGRIKPFPWDRGEPVHTFWDLGSMRNTRVIYVQFVGREIHIIDHDDGSLEMVPAERVSHMIGKGYHYGYHYMPHDAAAQEKSGLNFQQQMNRAGLEGIRVIPQCRSVWPGINKAHEILPRVLFHSVKCARLVAALEQYHTRKSAVDGHVTDAIVNDWSTHDTDALRMLAETLLNGMVGRDVARDGARGEGSTLRRCSTGRYGVRK